MESGIEKSRICLRKFIQDLMLWVWFKQGIIPERPSPEISLIPEISEEFMGNLRKSVWIESYSMELEWKDFLNNHFKRMTTTPYLFANYVAYGCYLLHRSSSSIYESSFCTLSLINHFALHCWQEERVEFVNTCVDLFCAFCEREICTEFENQGGWKSFSHNVEKQEFFIRYKKQIRDHPHTHDIFKELQNRHLESNESCNVDGVCLKDVTEDQVETHEESIEFAESIADKMRELCKKTFEEVLADFAETDRQVKELYRQTVGETSGGMTTVEDLASTEECQEEVMENIPNKTKSKNKDKKRTDKAADTLEAMDSNTIKSQASYPAPQESDLVLKSTKIVTVKRLLVEMLEDITKITELIKFICDESETKSPIKDVANNAPTS